MDGECINCGEIGNWCRCGETDSDSTNGIKMANMNQQTRQLLTHIAQQLETWARQSREGGWSTHQVEPQKELAQKIWAHLGQNTPDPILRWAENRLYIAQQNTGPRDDYQYQRDQGKIEILQDLIQEL